MRYIFKLTLLFFLLGKNSWARDLFLISHENRLKDALRLKMILQEKFHLPEEFIRVFSQSNCTADSKSLLHVCIVKNPNEDYRILNLNKKVMVESFQVLKEGSQNAN